MKKNNLLLLLILWGHIAIAEGAQKNETPSDYKEIACILRSITRRPGDFAISHPNIPLKNGTSGNWSGYAAATNLHNPKKDSVTKVTGTWIVPSVTATPQNGYSSIWVGIDGYTSSTVEQLGTEQDWASGRQSNYAWFEMYPNESYEIMGFPVDVGDSITATVAYVALNTFSLSIMNNTKKVFFTIPQSYTKSSVAQRSSAEWIIEAPSLNTVLPLAHFSTIFFSNCATTISNTNGTVQNRAWQTDAITMATQTGVTKSAPSALSANGTSFSAVWHHQ